MHATLSSFCLSLVMRPGLGSTLSYAASAWVFPCPQLRVLGIDSVPGHPLLYLSRLFFLCRSYVDTVLDLGIDLA